MSKEGKLTRRGLFGFLRNHMISFVAFVGAYLTADASSKQTLDSTHGREPGVASTTSKKYPVNTEYNSSVSSRFYTEATRQWLIVTGEKIDEILAMTGLTYIDVSFNGYYTSYGLIIELNGTQNQLENEIAKISALQLEKDEHFYRPNVARQYVADEKVKDLPARKSEIFGYLLVNVPREEVSKIVETLEREEIVSKLDILPWSPRKINASPDFELDRKILAELVADSPDIVDSVLTRVLGSLWPAESELLVSRAKIPTEIVQFL